MWITVNALTVEVGKVEMDIVGNANKNGESLVTKRKSKL